MAPINQGIQVALPPMAGGPDPGMLAAAASSAMQGQMPQAGGAVPPDPFADDAELLDLFDECRQECFDQKWTHERTWWRNLLYFLGRQWIYYDKGRGTWQDKRMAKWIPRPVTNKIRETVEAIESVFQSVELGVNCRPEGNSPKNIRTAETANEIEPSIVYEHDMARKQMIEDFWLITTGNCFKYLWWDKRGESGSVLVPYEQCSTCGTTVKPEALAETKGMCPTCGTPTMSAQQQPGPDGMPLGDTVTFGKGCTDVPSPFEVGMPEAYTDFDEIPYIVRKRWRDKRWCDRTYPKEMLAKLVWEKVSTDRGLQLLRSIQFLNDVSSASSTSGQSDQRGEGITEYELWYKPTEKYPKGLFLRVVGEGSTAMVVRDPSQSTPGPIPYTTQNGKPLWPWVMTVYSKVGGRVWGIGPVDPIIQKQDQLNQIDSLIQLIIQRTANPVWLEPRGAEVKKFTGEPGLVVKYNALIGGGNAKPERIEGQNVPLSLLQIRESFINDIEAMAGTYDVIKGAKPTGVEAFSALQLLVERSQSRYGPVLKARGDSHAKWFSVAIELERQFGPVTRTWSALGPNKRWSFQEFQNADLQGGINILVEDGSQTPKTSLGKRAAIEQLSQLQVLNVQNPDTAYRILQVFGQTDLWPGLDYDVKSALQQQDDWEKWAQQVQFIAPQTPFATDPTTGQPAQDMNTGAMVPAQPQPSVPPPGQAELWHNFAVHAAEHRKWANSDTVRNILQTRPELKPYLAWMILQDDTALMAQQQQQAMLAAGPPKEAQGGAKSLSNSNKESGQPHDVPKGTQQQPNGPQGPNMGPA
jgi:hypothetical protein